MIAKFALVLTLCSLCTGLPAQNLSSDIDRDSAIDVSIASIQTPRQHTAAKAGMSGAYVLEQGEQALFTRAWLTQNAGRSIDVQYFIWSTDNIGILAAQALLQAANRGVQVRVIVDDFMLDAENRFLLALAAHSRIQIRIYNPQHSVGVSTAKRVWTAITSTKKSNQRMHDKLFIADGKIAITGGRNMADEYFDYDHDYNFRDRDVLLNGAVVKAMSDSFQRFWQHPLSVPVDQLLDQKPMPPAQIKAVYEELNTYAQNPANFSPDVQTALATMDTQIATLFESMQWSRVDFLSDLPGKNNTQNLDGGGRSTASLIELLQQAKHSIVIQSPYLIMPDGGFDLFQKLLRKNLSVRISTNSLASTDNLYAFSGYLKQREQLLDLGLHIYEYKPYPKIMQQLWRSDQRKNPPVFALHAKTLVIDQSIVCIGTFNLDPRSANLNTEVGVVIHNAVLATQVQQAIETDMAPQNSWNARNEPDQQAGLWKRIKVRVFSWLPLDPLL